MSTSKPGQPGGGGSSNPYARFIPREELGSFAAWHPETFEQPAPAAATDEGGVRKPTLAERAAAEIRPAMKSGQGAHGAGKPKQPPPMAQAGQSSGQAPRPPNWRPIVGGVPGQAEAEAQAQAEAAARAASQAAQPAPDVEAMVEAARQSGYQDGYRNGLAALESYKQAQAEQMAHYMNEQVGALVESMQQRLDALEQQLAGRVAGVSLELARQVVRSELIDRPELVVDVAEQALSALLSSARQIVLRLHPEDHALVHGQLDELLQSRGARLVADTSITRGDVWSTPTLPWWMPRSSHAGSVLREPWGIRRLGKVDMRVACRQRVSRVGLMKGCEASGIRTRHFRMMQARYERSGQKFAAR